MPGPKPFEALETVEEFKRMVEQVEGHPNYRRPEAFGIGLGRFALSGELLDVRFPTVNLGENYGTAAAIAHATKNFSLVEENGAFKDKPTDAHLRLRQLFRPYMEDGSESPQTHPNIRAINAVFGATTPANERLVRPVLATVFDLQEAPQNAVDAWFRLHLLSNRKVQPHEICLDGIFGLMTNVAWTSQGPMLPGKVESRRTYDMQHFPTKTDLTVQSIDKFPRMTDYVIPSGVRIANADRVRLGAHLAEGTTVMHEGFVNFNAGTLGKSMVEGRISAGVVVGDGTDIGGGASIMGTLSGGGTEVISIGERCLLGANSGTGISLGNDCVIEAGLYVTGGKLINFEGNVVKAKELSGSSGLLFRQDSLTGMVEAIRREGKKVELNPALHQN